jgi:hypothetical protein
VNPVMTPAERYDLASAATNAAQAALKATIIGRAWFKHRHRRPRLARVLEYLMPRERVDAYHRAARASFFAMADEMNLPVLSTRKPS